MQGNRIAGSTASLLSAPRRSTFSRGVRADITAESGQSANESRVDDHAGSRLHVDHRYRLRSVGSCREFETIASGVKRTLEATSPSTVRVAAVAAVVLISLASLAGGQTAPSVGLTAYHVQGNVW